VASILQFETHVWRSLSGDIPTRLKTVARRRS
jgi:hypothetical protein